LSFGDLYSVPAGSPTPQGLPQVDLPTIPRRAPRTSITVGPADPWTGSGVAFQSPEKMGGENAPPADDWGSAGVKFTPPEEHVETRPAPREVGATEAFGNEAAQSATFGLSPVIHGISAAGKSPEERGEPEEEYLRRVAHDPVGALGGELGALVNGLKRRVARGPPRPTARAARRRSQPLKPAVSSIPMHPSLAAWRAPWRRHCQDWAQPASAAG
jgi:hypothetical protein